MRGIWAQWKTHAGAMTAETSVAKVSFMIGDAEESLWFEVR